MRSWMLSYWLVTFHRFSRLGESICQTLPKMKFLRIDSQSRIFRSDLLIRTQIDLERVEFISIFISVRSFFLKEEDHETLEIFRCLFLSLQ